MLTPEEIQNISKQWNRIVTAVRLWIDEYLWTKYEISDRGNRYSVYITIISLHHEGVYTRLQVYDHYEGYYYIDSSQTIPWVLLK